MQTRRDVLAALLASPFLAVAQSKPDFSGRWRVDTARSTFAVPPALTEVIEHREPTLSIDTTVDTNQPVGLALASLLGPRLHLTTTGAAETNSMPEGLSLASQSHWQGERLVTDWKLSGLQNGAMTGSWTRYLSDGGKAMTVELVAALGERRVETKLVFAKAA